MERFTALSILMSLGFLLLTSSAGRCEDDVASHRWTIGYERYSLYGSGPVLRHFLGEKWEVFFSGGPDDWRNSSNSQIWDEDIRGPLPVEIETRDSDSSGKREAGWAMLGGGRRLFSEDHFWLTAVMGLEYSWRNTQDVTYYERINEESQSIVEDREIVGHRQELSIFLGLRPAYDLTSRITVAAYFGLRYSSEVGTEDWHSRRIYYDTDGSILERSEDNERTSFENDDLRTYGVSGTSYLSFFFRF